MVLMRNTGKASRRTPLLPGDFMSAFSEKAFFFAPIDNRVRALQVFRIECRHLFGNEGLGMLGSNQPTDIPEYVRIAKHFIAVCGSPADLFLSVEASLIRLNIAWILLGPSRQTVK